jgi:hypothetical protein
MMQGVLLEFLLSLREAKLVDAGDSVAWIPIILVR